MDIYFVRHGETSGNVARRHQAEATPLSFEGETQVQAIAAQLASLAPQAIYSSSLVRAIESARYIATAADLVPTVSALFVELARPRSLIGHKHFYWRSLWFYVQWYFGFGHSGESYQNLRERITMARSLLEQSTHERVVVVSHSIFINFFIVHACSKRPLTPWGAAVTFYHLLTMPNATVVHFRYEPMSRGCAWRLINRRWGSGVASPE